MGPHLHIFPELPFCNSEQQPVIGAFRHKPSFFLMNRKLPFGIDRPELHQAFGRKAKKFTSRMVFHKTVSLTRKDTDQYGRTLGVIEVDGEFLDQALVRSGYAWHYRKFSSNRVLDSLENEARLNKRGLWADPDAMAPWEFRSEGKQKSMPAIRAM